MLQTAVLHVAVTMDKRFAAVHQDPRFARHATKKIYILQMKDFKP
jgi:hypothetical protein